MFKIIKSWIITKIRRSDYKKIHSIMKVASIVMELFHKKPTENVSEDTVHSLHQERLPVYRARAKKVLKKHTGPLTIAYGDSIIDFSREWIDSEIPDAFNFSIGGSIHLHMSRMIDDTYNIFNEHNVDYIVIGTLGGNSLLAGYGIDDTIKKSHETLDLLRKRYPKAKIIVYGLPPLYNIYATLNHIKFDMSLYEWVVRDGNSVFIPLQKSMSEDGILPNLDNSSDGTHLTEFGAVKFASLVKRSKKSKPGSIIDR